MEKLNYKVLKETGYDGYILENAPEKVMQFGEGNSCAHLSTTGSIWPMRRPIGTASAAWCSPSLPVWLR